MRDWLGLKADLGGNYKSIGGVSAREYNILLRPAAFAPPTVDVVLGYKKSNQSPILKLLLSRLDELVARASHKTR